ncbi:UDP-N-acetylmuramate--L-alanine ligase [Buchnera aphidicola (Muscaphis stroyani)]|uniref:UDP-N-acetylmuramate--L-alanine ligase n=2 Tax=Buchnera aphidicola TaxID=9 RepID=A0A4D6Y7A0_9GAMM|nr:UDP-N-acetylmuramate--L-alanine ligase [Buchnera aphidicola (Muscaphis stroyani)]
MSGIALILIKLGYQISGSDLFKNKMTDKLIKKGAIIYFKHTEKNIKNVDFIIISNAIQKNNPEIIAAKKMNIPVLLRSTILRALMNFRFGISISGTHGKTTTTSMITEIYISSGLNPTFINGGIIKSINTSAQLGSSPYFIVEADESDASFFYLSPKIAVITNIEPDHLDYYNGSFKKLKNTFLNFLNKIPSDGIAIVCIDNCAVREILPKIQCNLLTYGFDKTADFQIIFYEQKNFCGKFKLIRKQHFPLNITLNIPGRHNALNASAAICLATYQGIKDKYIVKSLKKFKGTQRRFEFLGTFSINYNNIYYGTVMLIDDYGHHPTELSETIKTIRISWPKKNLIMIFQPHRYTRTRDLYHEFIKVLSRVDHLLILNVYSSGESFISGSDSLSLYHDIKKTKKTNAVFIKNNKLILSTIINCLNENDIILIQGAGNIGEIMYKIFKKIKK